MSSFQLQSIDIVVTAIGLCLLFPARAFLCISNLLRATGRSCFPMRDMIATRHTQNSYVSDEAAGTHPLPIGTFPDSYSEVFHITRRGDRAFRRLFLSGRLLVGISDSVIPSCLHFPTSSWSQEKPHGQSTIRKTTALNVSSGYMWENKYGSKNISHASSGNAKRWASYGVRFTL